MFRRLTAPIRDVAYCSSSSPSSKVDQWVAVASDELDVVLKDCASLQEFRLPKHDGGVRSIEFDPQVGNG